LAERQSAFEESAVQRQSAELDAAVAQAADLDGSAEIHGSKGTAGIHRARQPGAAGLRRRRGLPTRQITIDIQSVGHQPDAVAGSAVVGGRQRSGKFRLIDNGFQAGNADLAGSAG
jgi:hypothetical protein